MSKANRNSNLTNHSLSASSYHFNKSNNNSVINNSVVTSRKAEINLGDNLNSDRTNFSSSEVNSALDSRIASDINRISTYQSGIISDFYKPRVQADYTVASEIDNDNKSINSMKSSISSGMSNPTSAKATSANSDITRADNLLKNANSIVPDANHYMDAYSSNWNNINDWQPEKKYYGLTYRYAPYEHALEFTSGTLNSDASDFSNDSDINKDIRDAKSIKFDSDINTIHTNNMSNMFQSDKNLESLNLGPSFNTSNVTNMANMFQHDINLKILNLPDSFNTSNVYDMAYIFNSDYNLNGLKLPKLFDTRKAGSDGIDWALTNALAPGSQLIIQSPHTFNIKNCLPTNAYYDPVINKKYWKEVFTDRISDASDATPRKDNEPGTNHKWAVGLYDNRPIVGTWYTFVAG